MEIEMLTAQEMKEKSMSARDSEFDYMMDLIENKIEVAACQHGQTEIDFFVHANDVPAMGPNWQERLTKHFEDLGYRIKILGNGMNGENLSIVIDW